MPPGTPTPGGAETTAIADVLAFEKATEAAVVRGDTAALERALAPTFLFTHGDGWVDGGPPLKVDTKASWIEWVRKQPAPYVYRELDSVQVELHGDVAITVGRYFYLPQSNGAPNHSQVWFERVYAKRNGQWQQLSHRTVKGPLRDPGGRRAVRGAVMRTSIAISICLRPSSPAGAGESVTRRGRRRACGRRQVRRRARSQDPAAIERCLPTMRINSIRQGSGGGVGTRSSKGRCSHRSAIAGRGASPSRPFAFRRQALQSPTANTGSASSVCGRRSCSRARATPGESRRFATRRRAATRP